MRRIEQTNEVRETIELTGREIQLITRALGFVDSTDLVSGLRDAEVELLQQFEELLMNTGLDFL